MGRTAREDKAIHNYYAAHTEAEAALGAAVITLQGSPAPATCSKPTEHTRNKPQDALPFGAQSPAATAAGKHLGAFGDSYTEPLDLGVSPSLAGTLRAITVRPCDYTIVMRQELCQALSVLTLAPQGTFP